MKSFKEHLQSDVQGTFLNSREFAEEVIVGGHNMTILIEEVQSKRFRKKDTYDYGYSNHSGVNKLISMRESDYALLGKPGREEWIVIDDTSYLITEIERDDGMVNLKVEVNR